MTTYNGWKNHQTWSIALSIENDVGLYMFAKEFRKKGYLAFISALKETDSIQNPDGVYWDDSNLDIEALDEMISEL